MLYTSYRYLFPPRPETAISPHQIPSFEMRNFAAQIKKNGTQNMIFVNRKENEIICRKRHYNTTTQDGERHEMWSPNAQNMAWTKLLPGQGWYVFAAELLHSKVKDGRKDTNYIFDILVDDGEYLIGTTFEERQERIRALFEAHVIGDDYSHVVVDPHLLVAIPFTENLFKLWNDVKDMGNKEDEGLVLKKINGILSLCGTAKANSGWMAKSRFPTKNYSF